MDAGLPTNIFASFSVCISISNIKLKHPTTLYHSEADFKKVSTNSFSL